MKKATLLACALLVLSTNLVAEESGFIRTAAETGTIYFEDGKKSEFTDFILADGSFKGETWGDFQLGYVAKKGHNENNDHDGYVYTEIRPGYNKGTSWGTFGGQIIIAQENMANSASGSDAIKPEIWGLIISIQSQEYLGGHCIPIKK